MTLYETTSRASLTPSLENSGSVNMAGLFSPMPTVSFLADAVAGSSAASARTGSATFRRRGRTEGMRTYSTPLRARLSHGSEPGLLLHVLAHLAEGAARLAVRDQPRVEPRRDVPEVRIHVQLAHALDLARQLEHELGRLQLALRGRLEAGELEDAARLGEPVLLAPERLHQRLRPRRAEAVDVRVVVDPAHLPRTLVCLAEALDV